MLTDKLKKLDDNLKQVSDSLNYIYPYDEPLYGKPISVWSEEIKTFNKRRELPKKSRKSINFLDYDGKELYTYEKDEFLALTSLPKLPSHDGLICQGWNYTLEDAIAYVQEYGKLDIGATYITDDNKTRLYIKLKNNGMSAPLYINQSVANGVTVEWGDGSSETLSGTGNVTFNHTYNKAGSYTISLTVNSGTCTLGHNSSSYNVIGSYNTIASTSLYKVEIGSNMSIGYYAFYNCYNLQSITIPNSVTAIGEYAFQYCYGLQSINIPNSVKIIYGKAFQYCYGLQNITIPNSVTSINDYAFEYCHNLQSITIPDSVTSISNSTFSSCYSLQDITIPNYITYIGQYAFSKCYNLQSITIPNAVTNSVTSIGNYAFQYCYNLQSITIPNSVKTINFYVFRLCYGLQSITIPDSVTSINSYAFSGCSNLQSITIPNSVTNIAGSYAFQNCYSMQYYDFTSHTSVPTLSNKNAFNGISSGCEIRVPYSLYEEWKAATNWSTYADYIVPYETITPPPIIETPDEAGVYVVYSDGTYDLADNMSDMVTANQVTGIGLVTDKVKMIVALDEWYSESESTAWNGNIRSAWGGYGTEVTGCFANTSSLMAITDFNGESNTDAIIAQLKDTTDSYSQYYTGAPAAEYCRAYSKGHKGVGEWYLPAAGELNEIALNKDTINTILTKLGKNSLSKNITTWSSSQSGSVSAWDCYWSISSWYGSGKSGVGGVRPVCAF